MRRAVTAFGTLCGLVLVILAGFGVVLLGANGTWHASARVPAGASAVLVDPQLASVLGPEVSVRVSAHEVAGAPVPLFVGRSRPDDAVAFVGVARHLRITGLDGARRLDTRPVAGGPTMPRVGSADIWHSRVVGDGKVEQSVVARPGAESVLIARPDGQPLPQVDVRLGWTNRWWYWIPALLLVSGLALLAVCREPGRWWSPAGGAPGADLRGGGRSRALPEPAVPSARPQSASVGAVTEPILGPASGPVARPAARRRGGAPGRRRAAPGSSRWR
jgi:hypothetical protein